MTTRMPTLYIPHGGGPWPFVNLPMGSPEEKQGLAHYLGNIVASLPAKPKAVLCISAHWEEADPTVSTHPAPPLLFDYYGFPPEAYAITWPAKGDVALADRVRSLLSNAGMTPKEAPERGFDHGTFVPLKLVFPNAEVPTVQLSLLKGLDPAKHIALGKALQILRDEGILILGSGMSYHNMRGFGDPGATKHSQDFDTWLGQVAVQTARDRESALLAWAVAPAARACHPREEHLLPLMVAAGAGGQDAGHVDYRGSFMGKRLSAVRFG
jgi:aromatic ring-opening dioxygenase catalytic subunit (LigB family)